MKHYSTEETEKLFDLGAATAFGFEEPVAVDGNGTVTKVARLAVVDSYSRGRHAIVQIGHPDDGFEDLYPLVPESLRDLADALNRLADRYDSLKVQGVVWRTVGC